MAESRPLRITLLRHGVAVDRADWGKKSDLARPLTPKGAKRVRTAARGLAALGVRPDLVLTSPAIRALQTAKIAAEELSVNSRELHEEPSLAPGAAPEDFLSMLDALEVREVLCVGHAPHLDEVLASLLGLRHGHSALNLKKSGAALLRLSSVEAGNADLRAVVSAWALRRIARRQNTR